MLKSTVAGAIVALLSLNATAQAATEVELKNMAARVIVTPENRSDIKLTVTYGKATVPKIRVAMRGDRLIANGGLKKRSYSCVNGQTVRLSGKRVALQDLPVIHLKVPMDARVASEGAVYGRIGDARTLELSLGGCGDWTTGNVTKEAALSLGGSGSIRTGNLGAANIALGGSGDVYTGSVNRLSGAIGGSGSITVAEIKGPMDIAIGGSGDVRIDKGYVPAMDISIAGSGDVRFGGEAHDVDLNIVGAGDISIRKVTGKVSKAILGSGNINIGS